MEDNPKPAPVGAIHESPLRGKMGPRIASNPAKAAQALGGQGNVESPFSSLDEQEEGILVLGLGDGLHRLLD